jgi:hypothetical protein
MICENAAMAACGYAATVPPDVGLAQNPARVKGDQR